MFLKYCKQLYIFSSPNTILEYDINIKEVWRMCLLLVQWSLVVVGSLVKQIQTIKQY